MQRTTCCTILLRGPNDFALEEIDRSMHDALCVMKRTLESGYVVPGGGCVEVALNVHLSNYAKTLSNKSQEAVTEFSNAMNIIPKTLTLNAALNAFELVAKLKTIHYHS